MNTFIKKTIVFLLGIIIFILSSYLILNGYVGKKSNFQLPEDITHVIFGHSHVETAYNDSLIFNFKNLAQSGDSYFNSFVKAKKVIEQNPQITTVFIEFTNIDVTQYRDEEIWDDKYINWKYPIYAALMNSEEHLFLVSKNPKSFINALPKAIKKNVSRITDNHYNYASATSGYLYVKESKLDSLLHAKAHKIPADKKYTKKSTYNLNYLEKLVELCQKNSLKIYFVRSPLYSDSHFLSNENLYNSIRLEKFSDIEFLDFSNFPIENHEFRDLHHLNHLGAEKFSKWFNQWLQKEINIDRVSHD